MHSKGYKERKRLNYISLTKGPQQMYNVCTPMLPIADIEKTQPVPILNQAVETQPTSSQDSAVTEGSQEILNKLEAQIDATQITCSPCTPPSQELSDMIGEIIDNYEPSEECQVQYNNYVKEILIKACETQQPHMSHQLKFRQN